MVQTEKNRTRRRPPAWRRRHGFRPQVEQLETRLVPSALPFPAVRDPGVGAVPMVQPVQGPTTNPGATIRGTRSEEHTSELQSRRDLVCRLLLEKKKDFKPNPEAGTTRSGVKSAGS